MEHWIVAVDPSGEWPTGTTAICVLNADLTELYYESSTVQAKDYTSKLKYWRSVIEAIQQSAPTKPRRKYYYVCEQFRLYANKAGALAWSTLETPRLIGIMEYHIPMLHLQGASEVMKRWSKEILEQKGFVMRGRRNKVCYNPYNEEPMTEHEVDALRHAIHFAKFKLKKEE